MTRTECDILIVGAGLAGAATAYHLRRRSEREVILVEQEDLPGAHSSGRNAALVGGPGDDPDTGGIVSEGAAFLRTAQLADFTLTGSMLLGLGDEDVAERVPPAVGTGLWRPDDGVVDVNGLLHAYLAGQHVRYNTRVLKWHVADARMEVSTSQGTFSCHLLVNAAGPWAGGLGDLPLTPLNRHLFVTPPLEAVDSRWPFVWHVPDGFYFRPEAGGLLLCACDEQPAVPGDYDTQNAPVERLALMIRTHLPGLGEISIKESWAGQRTFAPDRAFVIGHDPRCARLFHVAGLGGHGVNASWAAGRLAADRIVQGHTAPDAVFSPARLTAAHTADRG